ncbi:MAG TPA: surface-adhesin E family protein [Chromobacteriaceae bacterium]|nr:surface-adhesin E family protein [Chromobacteriaceae bacterium]
MKTGLCLFLAALTAPALAAQADWVVYQRGSALELAVDRQSIWLEKDGLVHFVNQERFSERQYEKGYRFAFDIRRTDGYADCSKNQFALVGSSYYTRNNQHIFSSMFPLQRYAWTWQPVYDGSVADAMLQVVCAAAKTAPRKKPE